jgi:imidazolonepropionase-like amidohydrolase
VHANLVDVTQGVVIPDQTVLTRGDRILEIGPSMEVEAPAGATVVDAAGGYLMPGLWDMHVHALWEEKVARVFLPLFVANGGTGVRDMGGSTAVRERFRTLAETGETVSPRIVAAGPFVDGINFYPGMTIVARDSSEGRAAADSVVASGGDFVKVYTQLPRDAFLALLERARELDVDVAGHVPAEVTPAEASVLGFKSIEHVRDEIEPLCRPGDECGELFDVFRDHATWQTPTLVVLRAKASLLDSSIVFDERHRYAPQLVRDEWSASRGSKMENPPQYFEEKAVRFRDEMWLVGAMYRAGVPLLAGSDAGSLYSLPGFGLHDELELLVEAGMSEADVLRSATLHPAEFLEVDDSLGTIESGKIADMVLLQRNPLEDVRNLQTIRAVFKRGALLDRDDLDALLRDAESDTAYW